MKPVVLLAIITSLALSGGAARAEGIPINPGKWEMKTVVEMPMMPEPRVMTSTECMQQSELSPDDMMNQSPQTGCTFSDIVIVENTVRWKVECPSPTGAFRGEGEVTSDGATVQGKSRMTTRMEGQEMIFRMRWEGRRVGDCD